MPGKLLPALPLLAALLAAGHAIASDGVLLITFIDKPPYYYLSASGNKPGGFLLTHAQRVFEQAGIRTRVEPRPSMRALVEIEHATQPVCSVGWFRNAERERFGRFSEPLFRDPPMIVATRSDRLARFKPYAGAGALVADPALVPGTVAGFAYGSYLDELLRQRSGHIDATAQTMQQNLAKVGLGRVDYAFVDQAEFSWWRRQAGLRGLPLAGLNLPDLPAGNLRYLLCSKQVDDVTMQRINRAIAALPKPQAPE
ncbi:extracellular solute-binding protein, family 3 [Andreprevotia lacus DSM 23236]|jgi:polar amino acid transport system substrate-binding protein|uniref:Extracellular solute-binding protein, family 3 n=1 Tax=Andreprevotia lacus DSM 23236 TaxID=1121001 RepID=A0A1W1Y1E0_9NEIS|nr:transporter substrate-binding domain-containing protein [Andreprevotia lacus]SMC29973.1 extracellular solute-binding protein, family 3 [Andreprevotia lacus DSM 23236]